MTGKEFNTIREDLSVSAESKSSLSSVDNDIVRPSYVEIDLAALRHNVELIKSSIGKDSKFMAVIKANAYGHGAGKIAGELSAMGVDFLGVAFLEEAEEIKNSGVDIPIVMLYPENIQRSVEAAKRGYQITVSSRRTLEKIVSRCDSGCYPVRYFFKINTGMNRYGMKITGPKDIESIISCPPGSELIGIMTNLADSNGNNVKLSREQTLRFSELMKDVRKSRGKNVLLSYESTGAILKSSPAEGSLVRIGHLMYGLTPEEDNAGEFRPVMSVKSVISEIQDVDAGEGIGYGFSHIAEKKMKIGVVPLGYADGYPWSLSNKGRVLVRGEYAPIVGRICMDAFMVDITEIPDCAEGVPVVVMGRMNERKIDAHMIGEWSGSFSYEILSGWSKRLPRIYR